MLEATWQRTILYQCNPDEDYNSIVADGRDPHDWKGPRGCGSPVVAYIFFSFFQILVTQVYLNLVIAIIVDAFTGMSAANKLPVDEKLIDAFVKVWGKYDPKGTYFIPTE